MPRYAVTGSTGHLGPLVIAGMLGLGIAPDDIVAVARTPAKAAALTEAGLQVRYGDYSKPETLPRALDGVGRLLLISGSEVGNRVAEHTSVVDAAVAAGVGHVVYTSVLRADSTQLAIAPEHKATERVIRQSNVPFTFLRNSFYTENYTAQIPSYLARGAIVGAAGGALISAAPRADYAAACVTALTQNSHRNAVYELGGPPFTMDDVAEAVSRATGTHLEYRNVSPGELRDSLIAAGMDEHHAAFVVRIEEGIARGDVYTDSHDLARLIRREPTPLAAVIAAAARA
jgi:NAD(P)H dehydrogenase (quinone)